MLTDVLEIRAASIIIALMMEVARTSETSIDIQLRTLQYIPDNFELHTRRCENFKSHTALVLIQSTSALMMEVVCSTEKFVYT
jgi:hypothetical protein